MFAAVSNAEVLSGQDNGVEFRCEAVRHVESGVILENQSANLLTPSHGDLGGSPESNSDNLR